VSADFVKIDSWDHPAFQELSKTLDSIVYWARFWAIHYYIQRYDSVIYMDDSTLINPKCKCTPNLFEFSEEHFVAPMDIPDGKIQKVDWKSMRDCCELARSDAVLFQKYTYCQTLKEYDTFGMFNAGLMLFHHDKHAEIFQEFIDHWQFLDLNKLWFEDMALLNFLIRANDKYVWVDLNNPEWLVIQGKHMLNRYYSGHKYSCIAHATRGTHRKRRNFVCNDWDWCMKPDPIARNSWEKG